MDGSTSGKSVTCQHALNLSPRNFCHGLQANTITYHIVNTIGAMLSIGIETYKTMHIARPWYIQVSYVPPFVPSKDNFYSLLLRYTTISWLHAPHILSYILYPFKVCERSYSHAHKSAVWCCWFPSLHVLGAVQAGSPRNSYHSGEHSSDSVYYGTAHLLEHCRGYTNRASLAIPPHTLSYRIQQLALKYTSRTLGG